MDGWGFISSKYNRHYLTLDVGLGFLNFGLTSLNVELAFLDVETTQKEAHLNIGHCYKKYPNSFSPTKLLQNFDIPS